MNEPARPAPQEGARPNGAQDAAPRPRGLDDRLRVGAVAAAGFGTMLAGLAGSAHPYGDPRFVPAFFGAELALAAVLTVAAIAGFEPRRIGLRAPARTGRAGRLLPLAAMVAVTVAAWAVARGRVVDAAALEPAATLGVLRTTALVGYAEELLFRGVLLAAAWRWWGPRRGSLAALAAFGAFHLLNVAAGLPPAAAAVQAVFTALVGATFVQAAVATRSLAIPMVAHAVYDCAVVDVARFAAAGAGAGPAVAVWLAAVAAGLVSLVAIRGLDGDEAYPR